jgi:hypothetical protein
MFRHWSTAETTAAIATWCAMTRPPYLPTRYEYDTDSNPNLPCMATVRAKHGSWKAAVRAVHELTSTTEARMFTAPAAPD